MVGRKLVEPALKRSKHLCTTFRPADAERIAAVCGADPYLTPSEFIYAAVMRLLPVVEAEIETEAKKAKQPTASPKP